MAHGHDGCNDESLISQLCHQDLHSTQATLGHAIEEQACLIGSISTRSALLRLPDCQEPASL